MTVKQRIDEFLAQKRLALVGASRKGSAFSTGLLRELRKRGYEVVPVNPNATEIEGQRCYASVGAVEPPVENVLIVGKKEAMPAMVQECIGAGTRRIWLHGASGPDSVSDEAVAACEEAGVAVVPGYCPHMFLEEAGVIHRFHGWVAKLIGQYPK